MARYLACAGPTGGWSAPGAHGTLRIVPARSGKGGRYERSNESHDKTEVHSDLGDDRHGAPRRGPARVRPEPRSHQEPAEVRGAAAASGLRPRPGHAGQVPLRPDRRPGRLLQDRDGPVPSELPPRPAEREAVGLRGRHERAPEVELPGRVDRRHQGNARPGELHQPASGPSPAAHRQHAPRRRNGPERQPGGRPPARRVHRLAERRRPLSLVDAAGAARFVLGPVAAEPPRNPDGRRLLVQRADRSAHVVPRPRGRHHPPQCLRGTRRGLHPRRRRRAADVRLRGQGPQGADPRDPAGPPGQELQERRGRLGAAGRPRLLEQVR